ncbi:MAG TPA: division/cell wall cluster transcriptional repressor MraZ [Longimicrobiales bacterium]|nr:division/cell wall cluster transcriptional repressor MraZ [Longimicrobiales bacterium]
MRDKSSENERGGTFLGSFVHQLDEKGRVSLPAPFRRDAGPLRFVLVQAHPPALSLYPEATWAEVEDRLKDMLRHQPESRLWVLSVMANAVEVTPDAQGRILIPARQQESAGLAGQVQLIGAIDKIEIWNPQRFEEAARQAGDFDRFASRIFQ